ncbi:MAG: IS3 family transposase [Sterolibacteriaceae bacterium]|nr:IS3 family transposase [Candidatus Methylophosphatis haderslevensis]
MRPWGAFPTRAEAQQAIVEYIGYYNTLRRHSSLGNVSPAEFERRWHASAISLGQRVSP